MNMHGVTMKIEKITLHLRTIHSVHDHKFLRMLDL